MSHAPAGDGEGGPPRRKKLHSSVRPKPTVIADLRPQYPCVAWRRPSGEVWLVVFWASRPDRMDGELRLLPGDRLSVEVHGGSDGGGRLIGTYTIEVERGGERLRAPGIRYDSDDHGANPPHAEFAAFAAAVTAAMAQEGETK